MNVIVSNKYAAMLSSLSTKIDLIKTVDGEFQVDDLIAQFDNFFFNKMILDITAISGYQDISQIQRLSFGMDMSKIVLLLDDSPVVNSQQYLSELVSMGIYNFTTCYFFSSSKVYNLPYKRIKARQTYPCTNFSNGCLYMWWHRYFWI